MPVNLYLSYVNPKSLKNIFLRPQDTPISPAFCPFSHGLRQDFTTPNRAEKHYKPDKH